MRLFSLLFGRPLATNEADSQRVGPLTGVPILGLDALGSASYGPEAALTILIPLGAVGLGYVREVVAVILALLLILYFSYRQTIAAYPGGGGSYTVAAENLGRRAGLVAAASLLLDYVLNAAVGISAGVGALESAVPQLQQHTLGLALAVLALVTLVNLRGARESGLAWSIPTYTFIGSLLFVLGVGIWKTIQSGGHPQPVVAPAALPAATATVSAWLIIRAFASGCTAMTGVEAVSNGVPIFSEPRVKKAQATLTIICGILGLLLGGVAFISRAYGIGAQDQQQPGYQSVISQLVAAVMGRGVLYYVTISSVLAVLTLSANTSFAGFPRLCRLLAEDGYLPASFASLGRRLVYTRGIIVLSALAAMLLIIFGGITDRLIPLFAVGAFAAFTFSQAGMVVHWWRRNFGRVDISLVVNGLGALATGAALVVIIVAKFTEGAWVSLLVIAVFVAMFSGIHRHYKRVAAELCAPRILEVTKARQVLVLVPMNGWNRMTERALQFALRLSGEITAVHISYSENAHNELKSSWNERVVKPAESCGITAPKLAVINSPYRQFFQPFLDFVESAKQEHPDQLVAIVIPELVEPRWWEYLLHNNTAATLKALLLFKGDERVVVISTPWYLRDRDAKK